MILKSYYTNILIRICLLTLVSLLTGWFFFSLKTYVGGGFAALILLIQVFELINYLNRTNLKIAFFFDAIRNEDFTLNFPARTGSKSANELNAALNKVNVLIKNIKFELEEQEQYFKTILEHVSIGILTFNENGNIFLSNTACKNLLNYEHLTHIDQISRIDKRLHAALKNLKPGDRRLVSFNNGKETIQLSLKSTLFKTAQDNLQLVTIQDIKNELEAKELESWVKLIRVLTHEIMNTIAPITSLSETILGYYKNRDNGTPDEKIINNTIKGLEVINDRGLGLIGFVDSYRKLTHLPHPEKAVINLSRLFDQIITLINSETIDATFSLSWEVNPSDLEIVADKKQISQVLINLIKNAAEALKNKKDGEIRLNAQINSESRPQVTVSDNGPGIPNDLLDKIFIPFYTTKDSGTGIGLSLSRQIMQLHGGTLKVKSEPGDTSFIIIF